MSERRCGAVVACQLPARSIASWLEQAAMFVLLGVVAFRALLQEVYEEPPGLDWLGGVLAAGPGPATTILIGGAIQLAVLLWLVAAAVRGRLAYRPAGLEIGWVLLLIASAISAGFAGNKRLAVVASADVLVQILLAAVLVQLLGEPRRQRLALAVVIASGTVFAVKCISQWAFEFEQTRCYWQQYVRPALSGYASQFDRAYLRLFEKRMEAAEASGYFFHSNVAGSYLVLVGFAGLGLAVVRAAWRPTRLWAVRLVGGLVGPGLCLAGLVLTRSRGAMVTGLVAAWLGALVLSGRLWVRRRRVAAAAIVVGPLVVGVMVLSLVVGARAGGRVGPGQAVGQVAGLFRGSVVFRMQYWRGASAMIADHWLTGVGPGNFGRRYLQYKPPGASEEVQNPHNLFFAVLAEWGWLGGAAVAAMIAGAGWVLVRRGRGGQVGDGSQQRVWAWAGGLGAAILLGRVLLYRQQSGGFILIEAMVPAAIWVGGFWLAAMPAGRRAGSASGGASLGGLLLGCGLVAFVLENLIGFSLFVPGAGTSFWALVGVGLAMRCSSQALPIRPGRWPAAIALTCFVAAAGIYWAWLGVPAVRAGRLICQARQAARQVGQPEDFWRCFELYRRAVEADPLDPTAARLMGRWLMRAGPVALRPDRLVEQIIVRLEQAVERDPYQAGLYRQLAAAYEWRYRLTGSAEELRQACRYMRQAVGLYPNYPKGHLLLGRLLGRTGRIVADRRLYAQAIEQLREALRLDGLYPAGEIRRFGASERGQIEELIGKLKDQMGRL